MRRRVSRPVLSSRLAQVVVIAAVLVLVAAGVSTAQSLITGADIKDGSIEGKELANATVGKKKIKKNAIIKKKLSENVQESLAERAERGPQGPAGAKGETGAPGQTLVSEQLTPPNAGLGGVNVVEIPAIAASSGGPALGAGAQLVPAVTLSQGTYLVYSTSQFFNFSGACTGAAYPVTKSFLNGTETGTGWNPPVPLQDGNNASQGSSTSLVRVPAAGASFTSSTAIRVGTGTVPTGCVYYGGALVIITRIAA